jgi:hypothetical protein
VDDERLGQRIVVALDALPVPAAPPRRATRPSGGQLFGGIASARLAIAAGAVLLAAVIVVQSISSSRPAAPQIKLATFSEDFSTGLLPSRWMTGGSGEGPTITAAEGRIEMVIPASAGAAGPTNWLMASITSRCVARGDYEASVDYTLLDWPRGNGVQVWLSEPPPGSAMVARNQQGPGEGIAIYDGVNSASMSESATAGTLRLVRRGTVLTGSHRAFGSADWTELPVRMSSLFDATFSVALFTQSPGFGGQRARVAIDNFQVTAPQVICPNP